MYLTTEQIEIGKLNFLTALGELRADYLEKSLQAPSVGQYYFGYGKVDKPVKAAIVGTGNEGCEAMIKQSSPEYLEFVAYHDIRPSQIARGRNYFKALYGKDQGEKVKFYDKWEDLLADKDIEAVVIATPLWTHAPLAISAMKAGKHVLCEKLMAHNIAECKKMVQVGDETKKVLAVGHQRHYSTLYDNAMQIVHSGMLGTVKHLRALWHRNNTWTTPEGELYDGWKPPIPDDDKSVDVKKYGYKSIEELVRWRLFDRTGGGLMAELGSHQLDACSLFMNKVHPENVSAVGGKYFYTDDRECADHVYCMYEMPGGTVLTYSTINTNAWAGYGEVVTGTLGTLMVLNERDVMLFKERQPGDTQLAEDTHIRIETGADGKKTIAGTKSLALPPKAALAQLALDKASQFTPPGAKAPMTNRGYHEEIEAFAFAIRNPGAKVRCDGRVALADAVMALTTNVAMRNKKRIEFDTAWYDPSSSAVPDGQDSSIAKTS